MFAAATSTTIAALRSQTYRALFTHLLNRNDTGSVLVAPRLAPNTPLQSFANSYLSLVTLPNANTLHKLTEYIARRLTSPVRFA